MCYPHSEFSDIYYKRLIEKGNIYLGGSTNINNEYLEAHGGELITLSKQVSYTFYKQTGYTDIEELQSQALNIIIRKCGNLVNNLEGMDTLLNKTIFNKTFKYLYSFIDDKKNEISLTIEDKDRGFIKEMDIKTEDPYKYNLKDNIDTTKAEFNEDEKEVMEYMIRLIEEGDAENLYKEVGNMIGIDEEDVLNIVLSIRQKMIEKQIVKERPNGEYEFSL